LSHVACSSEPMHTSPVERTSGSRTVKRERHNSTSSQHSCHSNVSRASSASRSSQRGSGGKRPKVSLVAAVAPMATVPKDLKPSTPHRMDRRERTPQVQPLWSSWKYNLIHNQWSSSTFINKLLWFTFMTGSGCEYYYIKNKKII